MLENVFPTEEMRGLARAKSRPYLTKSVHPKLVEEEKGGGWEILREGKRSVQLKRTKPTSTLLEDRVWTLLYRTQFQFLSGLGGARLIIDPKSPTSPKTQIDVVGIDSEVALAIECKSAEKISKRNQFAEELAKLSEIRERFSRSLNTQWPSTQKRHVALLFFLLNVELSENDRERARSANVHLFDEQDLEYYEKLTAHLGPAAKYQFLADMLPGKTISGLQIRVPAVKTKMGGFNCYTFPISPEYLLKISYVSHRTKGKASDVHTYQRMITRSRLNKIRQYITDAGIFPTNIVVNLDKKRLNFERIKQENTQAEQEASGVLGWLDIRPAYKSAWIIDGQHRLFAYSGHPRAYASHLSVLAFEGIQPSVQARLFIDINARQKSVKQSLLQELFAELHWDSEQPSVRIQAIISKAVQLLDVDKDSPLRGRIQGADSAKDHLRCVSLTSVFRSIENNRFHIVKERKEGVLEFGPLWAASNEATLNRTVYVLKHWLDQVRQGAPEWWDLGSAEGGGLAMNDGVTACINVLRSVVAHLDQKGKKLLHLDAEDLVAALQPYAIAMSEYLGNISVEDRKRFRELRGIQGQTTRTKRCQQAIRERIPDFNPPGLDEFIKREKEQTNLRAKEVIDRVERVLQKVVIDELKREFGPSDAEWWTLGVPKSLRIQVGQKYENDDGKRGVKEAYFDLIDYRKIVLENWTLFQSLLGYGKKNASKDKQTKWIVTLNDKRNVVSHPSSGVTLSLEELAELEAYEEWLQKSLTSTEGTINDDVDLKQESAEEVEVE